MTGIRSNCVLTRNFLVAIAPGEVSGTEPVNSVPASVEIDW